MQLTLSEIAKLIGAAEPHVAGSVAGYCIDSRTIRPQELFFAVKGQRMDGHDFVLPALAGDAVAAVVAQERVGSYPESARWKLLAVPNPLQSLQTLAAAVRQRWGGPLVAITGSAGKTTSKQIVATLLRTRFRVIENEGNLNNQFGLPLSLLRLEPEDEVGVFELGMSAAGEIRFLAGLAKPDVGVITNVSAAHLEFFPNVDAIALAKAELVESLSADGWAVLNADDARVRVMSSRSGAPVVRFGASADADFQAAQLHSNQDGGSSFILRTNRAQSASFGAAWKMQRGTGPASAASVAPPNFDQDVAFDVPLVGLHNASNVLAGLTVSHLFGIAASDLVTAVAKLRPVRMRGELQRLASGALVVNDSYNSNPQALERMLETVAGMPASRRFAVLGGMMELGAQSVALHRQCGRRVAELGYAELITVGEAALAFEEGARAAGMNAQFLVHCATPEEAGERLRGSLKAGDVVLLKASRSIHLERIWDRLEPKPVSGAQDSAFAEPARETRGSNSVSRMAG